MQTVHWYFLEANGWGNLSTETEMASFGFIPHNLKYFCISQSLKWGKKIHRSKGLAAWNLCGTNSHFSHTISCLHSHTGTQGTALTSSSHTVSFCIHTYLLHKKDMGRGEELKLLNRSTVSKTLYSFCKGGQKFKLHSTLGMEYSGLSRKMSEFQ